MDAENGKRIETRLLGESDGVPDEWLRPRYRIGQAAERTGVSADTLRYYAREGVLSPTGRTSGGSRRYSELDLEKVSCAHWLREAGVSIATIREFDVLRDQGRQTLTGRRAILMAHRDELRRRRDLLEASIVAVEQKIAKYDRIMETRR